MKEYRQKEREICYAKIILSDSDFIGWVRDISEIGCRTDFPVPSKPEIGCTYPFHIIAEESAEGLDVRGECQVRWIKEGHIFYSTGLEVTSFQRESDRNAYKALIDYYQQGQSEIPE